MKKLILNLNRLTKLAFTLAVCSVFFLACSSGEESETKDAEASVSTEGDNVVATANETESAPEESNLEAAIENSEESNKSGGTPAFTFTETSYDFGTVNEGDVVKKVFTFRNTGDAPLIISDATASCGCTVPQPPKDPIKPGEKDEIKVEFNTKGKSGKQTKTITITANTSPAITTLQLTGIVNRSSTDGPVR